MIKVAKPWDDVPFGNGGSFKISVGATLKIKMSINQLQHDDIDIPLQLSMRRLLTTVIGAHRAPTVEI